MRSTVNQLQAAAPVLGAGLAGCGWWVIAAAAALTVFLQGAEPAMKWLDVIERVRDERRVGTSSEPQAGRDPYNGVE